MADLSIVFAGIKAPQSVLAGFRAADRQSLQRGSRIRGWLGRRGLEKPWVRTRRRSTYRRVTRRTSGLIGRCLVLTTLN